jgi:outer membrane protein assembly factor BamB
MVAAMQRTLRRPVLLASVVTVSLVAAACGGADEAQTPQPPAATTASTAAPTSDATTDVDHDHDEDHDHDHDEDHDHDHDEDHDHDHDEDHDHDHDEDHDHDHDHDHDEHHDHDEDHDHGSDLPAPEGFVEVEEAAIRLVVADGADGAVRVVDLATEDLLAELELAAPARVYDAGRHALAAVRTADRLEILDIATWEQPHGDHFHYYAGTPTVTDAGVDADDPTHVVVHGGLAAVFNDGDGSVVVLDTHALGTDDQVIGRFDSGAAHHGVAVAIDDVVLVTTPVEGEALPDGVAVLDIETGSELERFGDCPELHGEATVGEFVAFGCADGVLVMERHDDHWHAHRIERPAGAERTGTLVAGSDPTIVIGNLGREALVRLDLVAETATVLPLPVPMSSFAFDPERDVVLVVTVDGQVHRIDPVSGEILHSESAVAPFELPTGHGGPPVPSIVVAGDRGYLTDPAAGAVIELGIVDELRIARRLEVGGTPASVAVAGLPGRSTH